MYSSDGSADIGEILALRHSAVKKFRVLEYVANQGDAKPFNCFEAKCGRDQALLKEVCETYRTEPECRNEGITALELLVLHISRLSIVPLLSDRDDSITILHLKSL